jgi:hypothetical protein
MTRTFHGKYDGKAIIPDGPVDLPADQELIVHVMMPKREEPGTPGASLLPLSGTISDEDAQEMLRVIEEGCGRVDPGEW